MFFYTSLFIASIIAALVILWLYNAIVEAGRVVYRAFLPSSKDSVTRHIKARPLATTINDTPTPWGWKSHSTPSNLARTHPAAPSGQAPWGRPGNDNEIHGRGPESTGAGLDSNMNRANSKQKERKVQKPNVGWPYREDMFEFAGKAYKVKRKVKPRKSNLKTTGTPWGW